MTKTPLNWLAASYIICALSASTSQASLINRGGGLIYDDVLNITWLQDANYAMTSGDDADGLLNWADANAWVAGLSYYDSVRNVTWSDWRLPTVSPVNGVSFNLAYSFDGSTDLSYNLVSTSSELANMFNVSLGNLGAYPTTGPSTVNSCYSSSANCLTNLGPFFGLYSNAYWTDTVTNTVMGRAFEFNMDSGNQSDAGMGERLYAWAVRDGDVAVSSIPEPATNALLFVGIGTMILVVSRRNRTSEPKVPS